MDFICKPADAFAGDVRVPGDKSISHRSIMLGAIANGVTRVSGFLEGDDALATIGAFRAMGVNIEGPDNGKVVVYGVGKHGLQAPQGDLYIGNSGTTIRLLSGLMAGQQFRVTMSGDVSLNKRPMERVATPLRLMGAEVTTGAAGRPPLTVGAGKLKGIHYELPMASAQVKSCVLLAGLYASGQTSVTEPAPTRDHTERMLNGFGYAVVRDGDTCSLDGGGELTALDIDVPADISSATFFMVAAAICPGSKLTLRHVGINPTRIGVVNILRAMGADISLANERDVGGEPVADISVAYAPLQGVAIDPLQVPLAIDEFPAIFIAAACATGVTTLTEAEELRVKESDRIQAMADGLHTLGVDARVLEDGIEITGKGGVDGPVFGGGDIDSQHDHRIAMSFAIASLRAADDIRIHGVDNVATSFPNFDQLANDCGLSVERL